MRKMKDSLASEFSHSGLPRFLAAFPLTRSTLAGARFIVLSSLFNGHRHLRVLTESLAFIWSTMARIFEQLVECNKSIA